MIRPWLGLGLYEAFLQEWLRVVPAEQLMVVRSEDYYNDTEGTLARLFDFAGLPPPSTAQWSEILAEGPANVNPTTHGRMQATNKSVGLLRDFFGERNPDLWQIVRDKNLEKRPARELDSHRF